MYIVVSLVMVAILYTVCGMVWEIHPNLGEVIMITIGTLIIDRAVKDAFDE